MSGLAGALPRVLPGGLPQVLPRVLVADYGGTLATGAVDRVLGQKPVDADAAEALWLLHGLGVGLVLASNTTAAQTRWPALVRAGVAGLFKLALLSAALGVAKPDPLFYRLVLAGAECQPAQVLFVGDNLQADVQQPMWHGMRAALIRPQGPRAGECVPPSVLVVPRFSALPGRLAGHADGGRCEWARGDGRA